MRALGRRALILNECRDARSANLPHARREPTTRFASARMLISLVFRDHVLINSQIAPAALSLAATCAWGLSDFLGGFASRRANAFLLTTITHISGTALMVFLALAFHSAV